MRKLLLAVICASAMGLPAFAQSIDERISAGLEAEGYRIVTLYRTWLGRIYVIAETDEVRREMVFNPATGEVLRDYAVTKGPPRNFADDNDSDNPSPDVAAATATIATGTRAGENKDDGLGTADITADAPSVILLEPVIVPPSD